MERLVLRSDLREQIISNVELQVNIHKGTGRSIETIKRWARENSELLTLEAVKAAIRRTLKLSKSESLTEIISATKVPA